jgi:poly(3-hydroxybutyrate) depolymerase
MRHESVIDEATGRKFYLDVPDDTGRPLTFLLNLHGGGSFGAWQRLYFPAHDYADTSALVVATPTAATGSPRPTTSISGTWSTWSRTASAAASGPSGWSVTRRAG